MALADILRAMDTAAAEEATRLLDTARTEADTLLTNAQRDADDMRGRLRRESEATAIAARARLQAEAQMRIVVRRAELRSAAIEGTLAATRTRLEEVRSSPDYPRVLRVLLAEALDGFHPDEELVVRVDSRDLQLLAVRPTLRLDSSLCTLGGVVVEGDQGRVIVDNTIERRLERAREQLAARLVALFEAAEPVPSSNAPVMVGA